MSQTDARPGRVENRAFPPRDLAAGLFFLVLAGGAFALSGSYPVGQAARMGPGFFPTFLGGILILFGIAIMITGFLVLTKASVESVRWR